MFFFRKNFPASRSKKSVEGIKQKNHKSQSHIDAVTVTASRMVQNSRVNLFCVLLFVWGVAQAYTLRRNFVL